MQNPSFAEVVKRYQELIQKAIRRIEEAHGAASVSAVLDDLIPASGELPTVSYFFHGLGCTARLDGYMVSWDWGRDGRTDEFEAWKLWQMTRDHPQEFGPLSLLDRIKVEMNRLHSQGVIEPVDEWNVVYRFAASEEN